MTTPALLGTLEGYAVEGGFDQAYAPATCYSPTIALQRHDGPGEASGLWRDYEEVLDLALTLPLDGIRLTPEWARVEPRRGVVDEAALARYVALATRVHDRGRRVTLALIDTVWPSWLGQEAWLLPWVVPHVLDHARRVARAAPFARLVPFTHAETFVTAGFLEGTMPPWRRGGHADAAFAYAQLAELTRLLAEDEEVGPRLVPRWCAGTIDELADADRRDVDEVYIRSLVRGAGPTSAPSGLLVRRGGRWEHGPEAARLDEVPRP